ncbi:MAG: endonuclease/exonuclease/phosphatase family protein, partial [Nanoarchaeota archaeon]|nr:endonuclease/exonuclease/phosphatase family protein [Nanoarchaeota archaeon]
MNYNVLHGFHQSFPPFALEEKRLEAAREIVKKENPDILVLTEACYGGPNPFNINIDYKSLFNFPQGFFGKWGDYEWGNFLLSKYPLKCKIVPFGTRTAIRSRISVNDKEIYLDVIHPYPSWTENEKIAFTKSILKNIKTPYFLVGDFNSLSDEDKYDKERLVRGFAKFEKEPVQAVNRIWEKKFIPWLRAQGLVDTFSTSSRKITVPTKIYGNGQESAMRMDFIFASPDIKTLETRVIKNKDTDSASDHY